MISGPTAADAEAQLVELFFHNWCGRNEALRWSVLFAARAADERDEVAAHRARGERDPGLWDEAVRLGAWSWIAREAAARKSVAVASR